MSMVMVWKHMASGIAVGVAGCLLMAAAYPRTSVCAEKGEGEV